MDDEGNGSVQEIVTDVGVIVENTCPVDVQARENPPPRDVARLTPVDDQE